jgi:hypothetical protein
VSAIESSSVIADNVGSLERVVSTQQQQIYHSILI